MHIKAKKIRDQTSVKFKQTAFNKYSEARQLEVKTNIINAARIKLIHHEHQLIYGTKIK